MVSGEGSPDHSGDIVLQLLAKRKRNVTPLFVWGLWKPMPKTHPGREIFSFARVPGASLTRAKGICGGSRDRREVESLDTLLHRKA